MPWDLMARIVNVRVARLIIENGVELMFVGLLYSSSIRGVVGCIVVSVVFHGIRKHFVNATLP